MTGTQPPRRNPYVGPRAFERGETLYGRDHEVLELLDLLIAERIVLFYSPSGAGKTSLIQAALVPELEQEGFSVLPPMRVGLEPPQSAGRAANRYVLSLLLSLEESLPRDEQAPLDELAALTLADYLDRRFKAGDGEPEGLVLIFDQFEEVLTVDPTGRAAKAEFFEQVGQALRDRRRWALFAMREEFVAGLDPFLRALPTRLATTYRLELLDPGAAREAIQQPPREGGVEFTDDAALALVDDLRQVRVQQADGSTEAQLGLHVEPVQLQVVCRRLWDRLPPGATQIVARDLEAVGDVDSALADYYAERVAAIAAATGVRERAIRDWVDGQLITEQGIRGQVLQGRGQSQGLPNRAIWPLVDAHLVRAEKRRGATWFELAHDRLIEPLRTDNTAWRERHLAALQRRAALWEGHRRPADLLLRDEALAEAEAWAAGHDDELTTVEREFLAACRQDRERIEQERRQARRIRWLAIGATAFAVVAVILALFAWSQRDRAMHAAQEEAAAKLEAETSLHAAQTAEAVAEEQRAQAEQQRRVAQSLALAAYAQTVQDPELAALLVLEAINQTHRAQPGTMTTEAVEAAHRVIGRSRWVATLGYHQLAVKYAAWSPDDARIVTAGEEGLAVVWDVATRSPLAVLRGHECNQYNLCTIHHAAWSPDGARIVTTGVDGTARVWDAASGAELLVFRGHGCDDIGQCDVFRAAWSADGRRVVTAGDDNTARVWDPATGEELLLLSGHRSSVERVAWSPDGRRILTASVDGTARVWDATTGAELLTLAGDVGYLLDAAWSPGGTWIAVAGGDDAAEVWDATTATRLATLQGHSRTLSSLAWSPDEAHVVTASWDGTARVWDAQTGQEILTLRGHAGWIRAAAYSPDGTRIVTASNDGAAKVWDAATGTELFTLRGCTSMSYYAAWNSDGTRLLATCSDGSARVWDAAETNDPFTLSGHGEGVNYAAWRPDGVQIATASEDETARVWDAATGAELLTLRGHDSAVNEVAWSHDARMIATASDDSTARVWDATTGELLGTARGHDTIVDHVAWDPDDARILTASWDGTAKIWNLRTAQIVTLDTGLEDLNDASWSPDGTRVVTAGADEAARVWDAATGEQLLTLGGHSEDVRSAEWSPDGRRIVTVGWFEEARLWDAATGAALSTLGVQAGWAEHAAWSPDGTRIVTEDGVWDATTGARLFPVSGQVSASAWRPDGKQILTLAADGVTVWDAATGAALFTLRGHDESYAAWSPDGTRIVTASEDGVARVFVVEIDGPGGLVELACARTGRNLGYGEWKKYTGEGLYDTTCPNLPPQHDALRGLLDDASGFVAEGDLEKAETFAGRAVQLALDAPDALSGNTVCWWGSLEGFAATVLPVCDRAVERADEARRPNFRDSRGLARALAGDHAGALEDFRAFVEAMQADAAYEDRVAERKAWIAALEAGQNPFDEETLLALREE
jgi:WD40 repeat protein